MSVSAIQLKEYAAFVAVAVKQQFSTLSEAVRIAADLSSGNALAFQAQYDEAIEQYTEDEIEREALAMLADNSVVLAKLCFGPLAYNCVTNGGTFYYAGEMVPDLDYTDDERKALRAFDGRPVQLDMDTQDGIRDLYRVYCNAFGFVQSIGQFDKAKILAIASAVGKYNSSPVARARELEKRIHDWQTTESRRIDRQAEDDRAYAEVPPQPLLPRDEIATRCRAAGCERVIIATYHIDESDLQTDYFGHRTSRSVVIGFGKGKRENFRQLREAAHIFPATAHLGPGRGRFTASACWDHDSTDATAKAASRYKDDSYYRKGNPIQWLDKVPVFETLAELEEYLTAHPLDAGATYSATDAKDGLERIEHRENYSMGGGNYLGSYRHNTGWTIKSESLQYFAGSSPMEFYEPATEDLARPKADPVKTKAPAKPYPVWNAKGYLSEGGYCARSFRKDETAAKEVAKLEKLGYRVEVKTSRRGDKFIQLVAAPVQAIEAEPVQVAEPVILYDWLGCPIN